MSGDGTGSGRRPATGENRVDLLTWGYYEVWEVACPPIRPIRWCAIRFAPTTRTVVRSIGPTRGGIFLRRRRLRPAGRCRPSSIRSSPTAFRQARPRGTRPPTCPTSTAARCAASSTIWAISPVWASRPFGSTRSSRRHPPWLPCHRLLRRQPRLGTIDDMRAGGQGPRARHPPAARFCRQSLGQQARLLPGGEGRPQQSLLQLVLLEELAEDYVAYYNVLDLPRSTSTIPKCASTCQNSIGYYGWATWVSTRLRIDHADGPSYDFWTDVRVVACSVKPDAWMFGELIRPPDQQLSYAGLFDGTPDFPMVCQALRDTFAAGR